MPRDLRFELSPYLDTSFKANVSLNIAVYCTEKQCWAFIQVLPKTDQPIDLKSDHLHHIILAIFLLLYLRFFLPLPLALLVLSLLYLIK